MSAVVYLCIHLVDEYPEDDRELKWISGDTLVTWNEYKACAFEPLESLSGLESATFEDIRPSQALRLQKAATGASRSATTPDLYGSLKARWPRAVNIIDHLHETCGYHEATWPNTNLMWPAVTEAGRAFETNEEAAYSVAHIRAQTLIEESQTLRYTSYLKRYRRMEEERKWRHLRLAQICRSCLKSGAQLSDEDFKTLMQDWD